MSRVLDEAYDNRLKAEEDASVQLAGGIMQHGYQCGMIWGVTLAAGAQAYKLYGAGPQAETQAVNAAQKIVSSFRDLKNTINCSEITAIDKSSSKFDMITYFFVKGGVIGCFNMAAKFAPIALKEINRAFSNDPVKGPESPVSCSALLAEKMGMSEQHRVMTAGFAGGIGLCGGACGALGAAIWIKAMKKHKAGNVKIDYDDPEVLEMIERFKKHTGSKFECSEIVDRKFENIEEHAGYLNSGGCSEIIDLLAADL